jgi:hypothetical protein
VRVVRQLLAPLVITYWQSAASQKCQQNNRILTSPAVVVAGYNGNIAIPRSTGLQKLTVLHEETSGLLLKIHSLCLRESCMGLCPEPDLSRGVVQNKPRGISPRANYTD